MKQVLVIVVFGLLVSLVNCQINIVITSNNPVVEGDDFEFACNDTGQNNININYLVDSTNSGDLFTRVMPSPEGDTRNFTFPNVQRSDNNTEFTCRISGISASVTLIVYFRANYTSPSVTEALFCGTPLAVSFDIMPGFPMSTFSLTRGGSPYTLPSGEVNATGIWIPSLSVSDTGDYMFTVTNDAGMTSVSLSLTVYCGPILRASNNGTSSMTVMEGGSFTIDCTVTQSVPAATIQLVINNGTSMDITSNPVQEFNNSMVINSGRTYRCIANSGQATTTHTYTVFVNQGTQNSMTPSMATPSPSATPVASDPPNGASVFKLGIFAVFILFVSIVVVIN